MTRYVIGPDVALHLAQEQVRVDGAHQLLAPTLLRSQLLSLAYRAVQRGELTRPEAQRHLDHVRVALTHLQADALVTLDDRLAAAAGRLVPLAPVVALSRAPHE